ncbi:glycoside hydrolase family 43 protein [Thioclava sp. FR2]|uniref:glycoside hydrolase family 43 protein n=1 Tax=Thioclava sp. FR2 TaxID=3445780 RepID=UPI003EBA94DB
MAQNPVLRGFNPDPSFCRVGKDYYIATSTFEWYPGVQIHHSRDLVNWRLVSRPLNRAALLDMRGNPDSGGIWAPCLSHADGRFWLVYTDVKRLDGDFKDAHNYITTCETIDGQWTDPWYVNSSGFDPSLFHDDDGRKWFVNMRWNHRGPGTGVNPAHNRFDGIELQEWSPERELFGPKHDIYAGTDLGLTEAPHVFKRDGWYYLTVAEGGTGYDHAVTMARSRRLTGPYETHPGKHLITARFAPENPIQRMGHGQYVEGHDGRHWHSFLCGRPQSGPDGKPFCATGRETGLAEMVWRDGWLWLAAGGQVAPTDLPIDVEQIASPPVRRKFQGPDLPPEFQWLRTPYPERLFTMTGECLRLTGRESLGSWYEQTLVARRQEEPSYHASATFRAEPSSWQQAVGLITYYNRHKFHAALITLEGGQRVVSLVSCLGDWPGEKLTFHGSTVIEEGEVTLSVRVDRADQRFSVNGREIGPSLNAALVSDEGGKGEHASFTGAFVGVCAFDLTGQGWHADVTDFEYENKI